MKLDGFIYRILSTFLYKRTISGKIIDLTRENIFWIEVSGEWISDHHHALSSKKIVLWKTNAKEECMKFIIGSVIGLIGSAVIIFVDVLFVKWLFTLIPPSGYADLVKVAIVFIDIWVTGGFCIIPFVLGIAIGKVLEDR